MPLILDGKFRDIRRVVDDIHLVLDEWQPNFIFLAHEANTIRLVHLPRLSVQNASSMASVPRKRSAFGSLR